MEDEQKKLTVQPSITTVRVLEFQHLKHCIRNIEMQNKAKMFLFSFLFWKRLVTIILDAWKSFFASCVFYKTIADANWYNVNVIFLDARRKRNYVDINFYNNEDDYVKLHFVFRLKSYHILCYSFYRTSSFFFFFERRLA